MADHGPASIAPAPQLACRHPRNPRNHRFISNRNTTSFKIPANPMKINPKPNSNRNKNTTSPRRESPFTNLPRRQAGHHSQITNHDSQTAGSASRSASRDANQDSRITRFPTCRRQSQGHKRRSPSTNHQPASPAGGPPLTNHVIFNRQPARLEIVVSHTKQRPATQFNRQHFTTPGITIRAFCVPDAVGGWPTLLAQATDRLSVFWGGCAIEARVMLRAARQASPCTSGSPSSLRVNELPQSQKRRRGCARAVPSQGALLWPLANERRSTLKCRRVL